MIRIAMARWWSAAKLSDLLPRAPPPRLARRRRLALAAAGVVLGAAASLLRQHPVPAWDTLWAEDATVLLADAVDHSIPDALATPVAGYALTAPRLLAEPVSWLPATWAAPAIALEAASATALLALFVFVASAAHLRHPLARWAAAAVCLVTPVGANDVPNALSNLHWPGVYATAWALLSVPRGRGEAMAGAAVAFAMAASNPVLLTLAPLAVARVFRGPRERGFWATVALAAGLLVQAAAVLMGSAASRTIPTRPDPVGAFTHFFASTVPRSLAGEATAPGLAAAAAWASVLIAIALAARRARTSLLPAGILAAQAFLFWMAAAGATGLRAGRYEATVCMLLTASLLVLARPADGSASTGPLVGLVAMLSIVWAIHFRTATLRGQGPSWTAAVERARIACAQPGTRRVDLPVAPVGGSWSARLPCRYLSD